MAGRRLTDCPGEYLNAPFHPRGGSDTIKHTSSEGIFSFPGSKLLHRGCTRRPTAYDEFGITEPAERKRIIVHPTGSPVS